MSPVMLPSTHESGIFFRFCRPNKSFRSSSRHQFIKNQKPIAFESWGTRAMADWSKSCWSGSKCISWSSLSPHCNRWWLRTKWELDPGKPHCFLSLSLCEGVRSCFSQFSMPKWTSSSQKLIGFYIHFFCTGLSLRVTVYAQSISLCTLIWYVWGACVSLHLFWFEWCSLLLQS